VDAATWAAYLQQYPEMGVLLGNIQTDTAFALNFGLFLTTLLRYGALKRSGTFVTMIAIIIGVTVTVVSAANQMVDGMALERYVSMLM